MTLPNKLTQDGILDVFHQFHVAKRTKAQIAYCMGIHPSTVGRILDRENNQELYATKMTPVTTTVIPQATYLAMGETLGNSHLNPYANKIDNSPTFTGKLTPEPDEELVNQNIKLANKVQRLQDTQRVERKSFREFARVDTMVLVLHEEMKKILSDNTFHTLTKEHHSDDSKPMGIVQLSDVHFNELVSDLESNSYDFNVASKRLHKLIRKAKIHFIANGVKEVALFLTGDLLNSDRRLDEIVNAATNRSKAVFLAVDIIQQIILDLNTEFNVTVASVVGNESRVGEHVHHTDFLAGDSFDAIIHNMLTLLFKDSVGVTFIPMDNPLECVIGNNILIVHGNLHRGLARNPEVEIEKIKSRYANRGVLISYVLCGHIHHALVSDLYARSSGLPGSNAYSERALNLSGRASQNIFLVYKNFGEIDGIKIDLQQVDNESAYVYDRGLESYAKKQKSNTVVIQSVII